MSDLNSPFTHPPSKIEQTLWNFYICGTPKTTHLQQFDLWLKNEKITHVIRLSVDYYPITGFKLSKVTFHDWAFPDGDSPPDSTLLQWFDLLDTIANEKDKPNICIHCTAGLGRAPQVICVALIEFKIMESDDAIAMIRKLRENALNNINMTRDHAW